VLTWLAVALLTGAAVVAIGWGLRRTDELGRPRRFPWVTVALLLAMGVGAAVPGVLRASQERRLGGAGVDEGPELGYVRWRADGSPEPWALIKRDQCHHLAAYVRSGARRPTRDQVVAVHVLTHEAMHMSGRLDEAVAECAAVQRDAQTARPLGARPADAAALAAAYWANIYPLMPDRYRSGECRPGGAMDERLADAPWLASLPA
jgi:sirohydrochlorin ferrochelatase